MGSYPVCLELAGRPAVVIGGDPQAEEKVRGLLAAGAAVTVVAESLAPGLAELAARGVVVHRPRAYQLGDLEGAFVAIVADRSRPRLTELAFAEARARAVLVNTVDDVAHCDFIAPAVVRRGELTVAVSTGGRAPALAVRLRQRLEGELGQEHARFLDFAGSVRQRLVARQPDFATRRALWYRLVDSDVLELLRRGDETAAAGRFEEILGVRPHPAAGGGRKEASGRAEGSEAGARGRGIVYLVGAGPGDPGLMTVRGLACLRRADVVVYDRLIGRELLAEAPPAAERIDVGKTPGRCSPRQEEIDALLVERAGAGKVVVRLKGGDPFVFGRGGEEALACAAAGVDWEVVPGVSSAIAVPALAGIPATHRGKARGFTVVSGHCLREDLDWEALARAETLIVLMGVERLPWITARLLAHGRAAATPAALIVDGSLPAEQVLTAPLGDLAAVAAAAAARPPAILVVGEVVSLRASLRPAARPAATAIPLPPLPAWAGRLAAAAGRGGATVVSHQRKQRHSL